MTTLFATQTFFFSNYLYYFECLHVLISEYFTRGDTFRNGKQCKSSRAVYARYVTREFDRLVIFPVN